MNEPLNRVQTPQINGPDEYRPTAPLAPPPTAQISSANERTDGITLIAGCHFLIAGLCLLATIILAFPTAILGIVAAVQDSDAWIGMVAVGFVGLITMLLTLFYLAVGYGLWTLKQWARVSAIALSVINLFAIPIGTVIGGLTIWYLLKPEIAGKFR